MGKLVASFDPDKAFMGTHVLVKESDRFLKKYYNKINYVSITPTGDYYLHDVGILVNKKADRLNTVGGNFPVFCSGAIEGEEFEWIEDSIIYDRGGNKI